MHPRISASLSLFRNTPRFLRQSPRVTLAVVAGTAAAASLATTAAVTAGSGSTHVSASAGTVPAVSTHPAHGSAHPAPVRPAHHGGATHLAVKVQAHRGGQSSHHSAARHHSARVRVHRLTHPYRLYDSVRPASIPARQAAAVYATGSYYATPAQVRHLGHSLWIDVTGRNYSASVLDVEPGDATPSQAASWVWHRLHAHPHSLARVYTMRSQWGPARAAMNGLPSWMRAHVHWWIADPTGVPHIIPGAQATQWYWGSNYDISSAKPGF